MNKYWDMVFLSIVLLCFVMHGIVFATSAQIEFSDPILPMPDDKSVHGKVFFGVVSGSDIYDAAGNIGATFDIGVVDKGSLYFSGDIFTYLEVKDGFSDFNPRRIIYTLEPGYVRVRGNSAYRFFIKHQSFHDVDSSDELDESYELYGLSYKSAGNPEFYIAAGKYLNVKDVDYEWDFTASATFDLQIIRNRSTYFHAWVHHITEDGTIDRNGFTDYAGELGISFKNNLTWFARYELLHDIDRFNGLTDNHAIIGARYIW